MDRTLIKVIKDYDLTESEQEVMRIILGLFSTYGKVLPITKEMVVTTHYKNGLFATGTVRSTVSAITTAIVDDMISNQNFNPEKMLHIFRHVTSVYNDIYNIVIHNSLQFVAGVSIFDYMDIQFDPKLIASIEEVREKMDVKSINESYKIVDYILKEDKKYEDNIIAIMFKTGIISDRQTKQMFGPRGFETELDAKIFKYPIANSFTLGLNDIYSFTTETRTAAKALFQSTKAIQDSEYFARTLQLLTMVVDGIEYKDCGNRETIPWFVKPKEEYMGSVTYNGDLKNLIGKHYLMNGEWKVINGTEEELIGTTIQLRSIKDCRLSDAHHICSSCFGYLAYNIPSNTNIGVLSTTMLLALVTQMILSTKHFTGSASTNLLNLSEDGKRFLTIKKKGFSIGTGIIKDRKTKLYLRVSTDNAYGLKDLNKTIDFRTIDPARVTRIEEVTFVLVTEETNEEFPVTIKQQNRFGFFSNKFLEFIMSRGFTIDDYGDYKIDITKWRQASPFIIIPDIEFSFSDFGAELKKLITSRQFNRFGETGDTFESLLSKVFTMILTKLNIPISYIEVIIYSLTTFDSKNKNFRLGRNTDNQGVGNLITAINSRSMGVAFGFDDLKHKMTSPYSFTTTSAMDTPLDVLLTPQASIEAYRKRKMKG